VLITEGYMDVLALHQFGYKNACGVLGTALTPEHITRLRGLTSRMELIFDGDRAGREAALKSARMILLHGLHCRVVTLPEDPQVKDIDLLLKKQGVEAFEALRAKAPDGLNYCMRVLNSTFAPRDTLFWVKDFLRELEQPELASLYISQLAQGLGLEESSIRRAMEDFSVRAEEGSPNRAADFAPEWKRDEGFLAFALRFPRHIKTLEQRGLGFILGSSRGMALWGRLCAMEIREVEANIFWDLNEEDRQFCLYNRLEAAIGPENAAGDLECQSLCARIEQIAQDKNRQAHRQALAALRIASSAEAGPGVAGSRAEGPGGVDEMLRAYGNAAKKRIRKENE